MLSSYSPYALRRVVAPIKCCLCEYHQRLTFSHSPFSAELFPATIGMFFLQQTLLFLLDYRVRLTDAMHSLLISMFSSGVVVGFI